MSEWYHGTSEVNSTAIMRDGFNVKAKRTSDPGDFGWGIYLTKSIHRARAYGSVVLRIDIDESRFARIANPYFLDGFNDVAPITDVEKLFHSMAYGVDRRGGRMMLTVRGGRTVREFASKLIADTFLEAGYAGIISEYSNGETVVFDASAVVGITLSVLDPVSD